jgi:hypothetical protein
VNSQAGNAAVAFQQHTVRALDSLQRTTNGIGHTAKHFQLCAFLEIGCCFLRATETVQNQAAIIKRSWIADAAGNCRVQ